MVRLVSQFRKGTKFENFGVKYYSPNLLRKEKYFSWIEQVKQKDFQKYG